MFSTALFSSKSACCRCDCCRLFSISARRWYRASLRAPPIATAHYWIILRRCLKEFYGPWESYGMLGQGFPQGHKLSCYRKTGQKESVYHNGRTEASEIEVPHTPVQRQCYCLWGACPDWGPGKGMVVSPVKGQGEVELRTNCRDLNSSLFTYVDYDDNVTLAVLICGSNI